MTFTDMVTAIQQIQTQLATLAPSAGAGSTGSATAFADALSGAGTASSTPEVSSTASTDGQLIDANGVTGQDVVKDALKYQGVPYVFGGESSSGMDCSGLVQKTFSDLGISVPRLVHQQQTVGQKVDSLKDAKPGDLIVLDGGNHIAIYAGNDTVIHAPYAGRTVCVEKDWFTDKDITAIRRIVPSTDADTGAASSSAVSSTSGSSVSASTAADIAALSAMYGSSDGSSSLTSATSLLDGTGASSASASGGGLSSLLAGLDGSSSSSTVQQLVAALAGISS